MGFDVLKPEDRPEDEWMHGKRLRFEMAKHGASEPEVMPQAIIVTDPVQPASQPVRSRVVLPPSMRLAVSGLATVVFPVRPCQQKRPPPFH